MNFRGVVWTRRGRKLNLKSKSCMIAKHTDQKLFCRGIVEVILYCRWLLRLVQNVSTDWHLPLRGVKNHMPPPRQHR